VKTRLQTLLISRAACTAYTEYRAMLCAPGEQGGVPSTGLVAVFIFANMCESLTVVGFGAGSRGGAVQVESSLTRSLKPPGCNP
jgi:hypothetical protein